jgi:hypothetical protein
MHVIKLFKMAECNSKVQSADPFSKLTATGIDGGPCSPTAEKSVYHEAVGSLIFLMVCTRPDISYAAGQVTKL